jgi:hypothetical protein
MCLEPAAGRNVRVLDFGWRPAQFGALLASGTHETDLSRDSRLSDLVTAQVLFWPLLAACSIKVRNQDGHFKPEYVVPQLILQWLTTEHKVDGVRYFTTKVARYFPDPTPAANFVFPVRSTKPLGFCDQLSSTFELSDPVYWPAVAKTAPPVGSTPHTNFTLDITAMPYNQTDLGRLQHCAASLPCGRI